MSSIFDSGRGQATDSPVEMFGRQAIEPKGDGGSRLTISVDIPGTPNPLDPMPMENSLRRITELIESETQGRGPFRT